MNSDLYCVKVFTILVSNPIDHYMGPLWFKLIILRMNELWHSLSLLWIVHYKFNGPIIYGCFRVQSELFSNKTTFLSEIKRERNRGFCSIMTYLNSSLNILVCIGQSSLCLLDWNRVHSIWEGISALSTYWWSAKSNCTPLITVYWQLASIG